MKPILKWIFGGSRVDRLLLAATVVAGGGLVLIAAGFIGFGLWGWARVPRGGGGGGVGFPDDRGGGVGRGRRGSGSGSRSRFLRGPYRHTLYGPAGRIRHRQDFNSLGQNYLRHFYGELALTRLGRAPLGEF